MDFEKRLAELFVELPEVPKFSEGIAAAIAAEKVLYVGMQLPLQAGKIAFKGRVGIEVTLDQARLAARYALLGGLSAIRQTAGSLNAVKQFLQLNGWIAAGGEFKDFDRLLEPASKLLLDIFGSAGRHTRTAVGVSQLPQGACVGMALSVALR